MDNVEDNVVEVLRGITSGLVDAEQRPEQEEAAKLVNASISNGKALLLEAGTGTGKTLAYLTPLVLSGKKGVVSTATKQLSEQIVDKDIPFLKNAVKEIVPDKAGFTYALLKGRDNYFCWYKDAETSKLDDGGTVGDYSDSSVAKQIKELKAWADESKTGDRAEAPDSVSDKIWRQYSSTSVECVGKSICPFGSECFAEKARDKARTVDIVVTNHAVVAHDMSAEMANLGEREVVVFDELHEVDKYMTDAWGATLSANMLKDAALMLKPVEGLVGLPENEFAVSLQLLKSSEVLQLALSEVEPGRIPTPSGILQKTLMEVRMVCFEAVTKIAEHGSKNNTDVFQQDVAPVRKKLEKIVEAIDLLTYEKDDVVKWVGRQNSKDEKTSQLQAAPLYAGVKLQKYLKEYNMTMVGVSATIRVGESFTSPLQNLGFHDTSKVTTSHVLSPFDYKKQAMLYIPDSSFPTPVGYDRKNHTEAVKAVSYQLIEAMRGRAVVLTTTSNGIVEIGEYLRKKLPQLNILLQGDAPNSQIVEKFIEDKHSVIVGTMGLWHGLDLPGDTASLLIIDKIPFKPMDDPLLEARKEYVEMRGGNGFSEVFVPEASIMLTQGFGRLIRRKTDKGIIAILDNRLLTKSYGKVLLQSLPKISINTNREKIVAAAERLAVLLDGE